MTTQITAEAISESRGRLFGEGWPVAPGYRIEEGVVTALNEQGHPVSDHLAFPVAYMPMSRPELPGELAKIAGGDEAAVLAFVKRYGLLGYARALMPIEANALRLVRARGTGYDPLLDTRYDPAQRGDPVAWFLAHAATVRLIGDLAAALDTPDELRRLFERMIVSDDGTAEVRFTRAVRGWTHPKQGRLPVPNAASRRTTALGIIALCLNDNLGGVVRSMQLDGTGGLVSYFRANNLLDYIYWMLADAAAGHRIRPCQACGHFFLATTDRMKHCPLPMGLEGVSRCMHRAKMKRWREKRREQEQQRAVRHQRRPARSKQKRPASRQPRRNHR